MEEPTNENFEQILKYAKGIISNQISNINQNFVHDENIEWKLENNLKNSCDDLNTGEVNQNIDSSKTKTNCVDKLNFGSKELLVLITEYDKLKENYLQLQAEVEKKLKKTSEDAINANKYLKENNLLKGKNQQLQLEIDNLSLKYEANFIQQIELSNSLENTIERLELDVRAQKSATAAVVDKLTAHDAAAKRAIAVLQKEMGARIEKITKDYKESVNENDAYIIKISKLEQCLEEYNANAKSKNVSEEISEIEELKGLLKTKESDYNKIVALNESYQKDIAKLSKNQEKHKEEMEGLEIKVKWSQNKLKSELDSRKETRKQLAHMSSKLKEAKEEGEQIRKNCQEMIQRYQGDEEIKSVHQNKVIIEQESELKIHKEIIKEQKEINEQKDNQLHGLKQDNKKLLTESQNLKSETILLEEKNTNLSHQLSEKVKDIVELETTLERLKDELKELQSVKMEAKQYKEEIKALKEQEEILLQKVQQYDIDVKRHKEKEQEILLYTQSITENNAFSKVTATELRSKLEKVLKEKQEVNDKLEAYEKQHHSEVKSLEQEKENLQTNSNKLLNQLSQKSNAVNQLSASLEEALNEIKVIKKKNASQLKDLQRQLHQTTRKIEQLETSDTFSATSRTSSCNSLEKIPPNDSPPNFSTSPHATHDSVVIPQDHYINQPNRNGSRNNSSNLDIEIDKKVLVDKICKLQRLHAKKNEKIEFMKEHVNHLTEDVQNKSKIIHHYVLKEEAGSLTPDRFDKNKADVSQHGGIMASVYSAKSSDKDMTLDLSLTINRKLQAVLEDNILKNIMLKENINTLGIEIARLQDELRLLQGK